MIDIYVVLPYSAPSMDHVAKNSCTERFELRLTPELKRQLAWLRVRLNRSGNSIMRTALARMYEEEQRAMLIQAGFPNGRLP